MVGKKFERKGRADVLLIAAPRVASHFLDRVLAGANLAVLDRPKSSDPVVEQIIQPPAETFGLLVPEIADVERRILEFPFEPRCARFATATFELLILIMFLSLFGIVSPMFLWQNLRYAYPAHLYRRAIITPTSDILPCAVRQSYAALYLLGIGVSYLVTGHTQRRAEKGWRVISLFWVVLFHRVFMLFNVYGGPYYARPTALAMMPAASAGAPSPAQGDKRSGEPASSFAS